MNKHRNDKLILRKLRANKLAAVFYYIILTYIILQAVGSNVLKHDAVRFRRVYSLEMNEAISIIAFECNTSENLAYQEPYFQKHYIANEDHSTL